MNIFKNKQTHEYKEKERYRLRRARIWGYKIGKKYAIGEKIAKAMPGQTVIDERLSEYCFP